jgi:chromosome partitioning protein
MEIISMYNLKGGVGKTTSTHSLASALSELGKKVLVMDIDPQSSLTFMLTDERLDATTKDLLKESKTVEECIKVGDKFDFIGSTLELTLAEIELNQIYSKESILKLQIDNSSIRDKYDYFLIDCPPSLGIFTLNALTASSDLIIPCECELASLEGLDLLLATLKTPINTLNPDLKILGILPTKLDARKKISKETYEVIKEEQKNVFTPIRVNSKLSELGINKVSIFKHDPSSNGAKDYLKVAKEIING